MTKPHFIVKPNWVDCVTLTGFVLACTAVFSAINNAIALALGWLFLAVLADAFDGVLARKYGTERPFGRYLDSFVDCVIYLTAPCVIFFQLGYSQLLSVVAMLIFILAGIIRLSVFNDIGNSIKSGNLGYLGLPVFWSVFLVAAYFSLGPIISAQWLQGGLTAILIIYAYLMLKNSQFYKPKNKVVMLSVLLSLSGYYFYTALSF